MSNSRFRAIPKLDTFNIPFKLKEARLLDWLVNLSHQSGQEACLHTLHLTQALNNKTDLTAKTRISFLKLIHQYLKSYIVHLDSPCWDAGFPLAMEERIYAEIITWNYLSLGQGFFNAAAQTSKKDEELFALAMALHSLGQAQLHIAAVYSTADTGFWTLVYHIFIFAEKRKLLSSEISSDDFENISLHTLFVRLLVFQVCDTNQFRPRDMRTIFNFLPKVCQNIPIHHLFNGEKDLFLFDTDTDIPPVAVKKQTEFANESARYFSPMMVAENIHAQLKKGDLWSGTLKSINNTLFRRVIKTLEQKQKRVYTRKSESRLLLGVIGFDDILSFLYTVTKKSTPPLSALVDNSLTTTKSEPDTPESSTFKNGHPIWDNHDHHAHLANIANKKISLKKLTVFDSSANGYSLYWNQSDAKAKVGDIFGIISDDKKRLEIALIRRIAMSDNQQFRFGTEVVGFESELVYTRPIDAKEHGNWAIFIPGIALLNKPDTLIYAIGQFKAGDGIFIYRTEGKKLAVLVAELHSTAMISHAELIYPPSKRN